jgi:hypothetical protein
VFMSERSLTGYDNRDAVSGLPDEEVYLYDTVTAGLGVCRVIRRVCGRLGMWCRGDRLGAAWMVVRPTVLSRSRYLSDDGGRVFFNSSDALVPEDTDGGEDVYEWEREGAGGCGLRRFRWLGESAFQRHLYSGWPCGHHAERGRRAVHDDRAARASGYRRGL